MNSAAAELNSRTASRVTLVRLVIFSISLGAAPLVTYFGTLQYLWDGNATFSAISAVAVANIVLIAYIVTSLLEDRQSTPTSSTASVSETKKER